MKKMIAISARRFLSLIVSAAIILSCVPITAAAEDGVRSDSALTPAESADTGGEEQGGESDPVDGEPGPEPSGAVIIAAFDSLDEAILRQVYDFGEISSQDELTLPQTLAAEALDETLVAVEGVIWESKPVFAAVTVGTLEFIPAGTYVFTPELPQDFELADSVSLPVITVEIQPMEVKAAATAGAFEVTGDSGGYTYASSTLNIIQNGTYTIANTDPATAANDCIVVQSGLTNVNITLNGVNIDVSGKYSTSAFDMTGAAVNLTLAGTNTLKSGSYKAGLQVPAGAALTIGGTGSLAATAGSSSAGIGGGYQGNGGVITINSGTVTATGGQYAAGIGGVRDGNGGVITINSGTVTATGGQYGTGIGGGYQGYGGEIIISGGKVTATGSYNGVGIGNGIGGADGMITISGDAEVTATGGRDSGAGIGGGYFGTININGGTVTASGSSSSAGIDGSSGTININGGTVTATGGNDGAGFNGMITINNGTVNAEGGSNSAGIGGGNGKNGGKIEINGGTVTATGGYYGAGIGGGWYGNGGEITINGGTVTATGGQSGAGIGGGYQGNGGEITISGGTVTATGSNSGAGIGSGSGGGMITISGDAEVTATGGSSGAGIGGGSNVTINISGGTVTASGGSSGAGIGGYNITINISGGTITANGGRVGAGIGGSGRDGGNIAISGGTVTANGGYGAAGIGGGGSGGDGGNITISDSATVEATGGESGAGIGGGTESAGGTITISGNAEVKATGGKYAAGIGSGDLAGGGTVEISGGTVEANGGSSGGAGIGGSDGSSGGTVEISGGTVTANGGSAGAGIGGSAGGTGGTIKIMGGFVNAKSGSAGAKDIGAGRSGAAGTTTITGGSVFAANNNIDGFGAITRYPVKVTAESADIKVDGATVECGTYTAITGGNLTDAFAAGTLDEGVAWLWLPAGEQSIKASKGTSSGSGSLPVDTTGINPITIIMFDHGIKLGTPTNVAVTNAGVVSWRAVANASSYTIKVYKSDGTTVLAAVKDKTGTSYALTNADIAGITYDGADYCVTVTAIGDSTAYSDGDESAKSSGKFMNVYSVGLTTAGYKHGDTVSFNGSAITSDTTTTAYAIRGTTVAFSAAGGTGRMVTLTGDVTANGDITNITASKVFTVTFSEQDYPVTVIYGTGGGFYVRGESVTAEANPASGNNRFKAWEAEGLTGVDLTQNPLIFTMPGNIVKLTAIYENIPAAVSEVIVDPSIVSVGKGETYQFTATVNGTRNPPQTVTWSVAGGLGTTGINEDGTLTVDANETAGSLTVTAASAYDTSKSGTAEVTVKTSVTGLTLNKKNLALFTEAEPKEATLVAAIAPAAATNKNVEWKSNNTDVATVDPVTGLITAVNAGSATISARSEDNPGKYDYCWVTVAETNNSTRDIVITSDPAGAVEINQNKNNAYTMSGYVSDTKDTLIILTADNVTWKTSDAKVATVKAISKTNKAEVTYKGTGTAIITAASTDKTGGLKGISATVTVTVNDEAPKVPVTSLTVYNQSETGTAFTVLPSNTFGFNGLTITNVLDSKKKEQPNWQTQFDVAGSGTDWKLSTTAPKGTYTVELQATNTADPTQETGKFSIKVTVLETLPTARLKMPTLNTFWKKAEGEITITGSNLPEIERIYIDPASDLNKNFQIEKRGDKFYVKAEENFPASGYDNNNKLIVKGKIKIEYKDIDQEQEITFTIPVKPVVPKLTLTPVTQTINIKDGMAAATIKLIGGKMAVNDGSVETAAITKSNSNDLIESTSVTAEDTFTVTLTTDAKPSKALNLNILLDGARTPILVKPTVKTVTADGKFKLSAGTLTFFTKGTEQAPVQTQQQTVRLIPDIANASISNVRITPVTPSGKGAVPAPDIVKAYGSELVVTVDANTDAGTHKYKISADGVTTEQTLTVKVDKTKLLAATVKAEKGNIDLMDRGNTQLIYVPAIKNTQEQIRNGKAGVEFAPAAATETANSDLQRADTKLEVKIQGGKAVVTTKPDTEINKGESFRVKLKFMLEDGNTTETGAITIKPAQSAVKHSIPKNLTMYQSRTDVDKHIIVDLKPLTPAGTRLAKDGLKFKDETEKNLKAGKYVNNPDNAYWYSFDPVSQKLHIWIQYSELVKPGKAALTFSVIYEGQGCEAYKTVNGEQVAAGREPKPIDLKIPVNILR